MLEYLTTQRQQQEYQLEQSVKAAEDFGIKKC